MRIELNCAVCGSNRFSLDQGNSDRSLKKAASYGCDEQPSWSNDYYRSIRVYYPRKA